MDSLQDLLSQYSSPKEPAEVVAIKKYINDTFSMPSSIVVQDTAIVITVQSSALANALRLRYTDLQAVVGATKKLIFRIG
jgi:hypothetical protein